MISSTAVQRFLRYVTYDTQSDERSTAVPSTEKQVALQRVLSTDLRAIGLTDLVSTTTAT